MHRASRTLALTALCALAAAASARGAFVANLGVSVGQESGGYFRYTYTLANASTSTLPAVQFDLAVDVAADLQEIAAPTGWAFDYQAGSESISFFADVLSAPIVPGASAVFSFLSILGPGSQAYYLVGSNPPGFQVLDGEIAAPAAVPEPPSWMILASSSAVASAWGFRRSRRSRT